MLDYASLAAVAAVVQQGSFDRAAKALNVTPSAVSQRVKLLEERLGTVLIKRGQPCIATEAGRLLCRHVERVGMLEHDLRATLPQIGSETADPRATLRIAVNADTLATWFIAAMAQFVRQERALLDVALDDEQHTVEWLRTGQVLAAVTSHAKPVQGCNSTPLGRTRYLAVASPEFVKRYFSAGVDATSLADAPSLLFSTKDRLQATWMRRLCRREIQAPAHWLPSTQAFVDAAVAGIGWAMNPASLIREQLKSGALVELVPDKPLLVPLYWQHTRLQVPMLDRLTKIVTATRFT
ncbi:MAG TPA: LysR family transcriptional regulator ArgP [Steroidobacteraceae bacterium]|nr:LysR family transcriptional regulator ArgP [Steroidobacteraceae bacterium]